MVLGLGLEVVGLGYHPLTKPASQLCPSSRHSLSRNTLEFIWIAMSGSEVQGWEWHGLGNNGETSLINSAIRASAVNRPVPKRCELASAVSSAWCAGNLLQSAQGARFRRVEKMNLPLPPRAETATAFSRSSDRCPSRAAVSAGGRVWGPSTSPGSSRRPVRRARCPRALPPSWRVRGARCAAGALKGRESCRAELCCSVKTIPSVVTR